MTQHERELSNLSYTNKDFQTIYPELLDLARKISYKWNPVESDESDPGVVLLKLAALMTDKLNYNIDKNILELFPLSVTQDTNARQLFDQCGYSMKYYQSATMDVSFAMISEPEISDSDIAQLAPNSSITLDDLENPIYTRSYLLPKFTMVSDVDNEIVYTTIEDVIIKSDKVRVSVPAIQGIVQKYTINGQSLITAANLDYNNRLYFTETDIAENGIFISNETGYNYTSWKKVDNLILQPLGTPCYKFGLTEDGSMCYIEFPTDVDSLIGNGIQIHYIITRGFDGNIGKKRIEHFYVDTSATRRFSYESANSKYTQVVTLTSENVAVTNSYAASNGKDPETIDEAYKNYQRVKSTFDTLVSLKDYTDFLYTNKNYSNGFVCDRTNDVESSYKVVENKGTYTRTHSMVKQQDGKDELSAFDLRVYGLTYVDNVTTPAGYVKSFTVLEDNETLASDWYQIKVDTLNVKSIQHDYQDYIPNRPIMFKNKFPIIAKIIPQYKLADAQKQDVLAKIETALCSALNSRQLVFGEEVEYDVVYDTIMNADPRIKALILDNIEYETYAVYKNDKNEIKEIRIDSKSTPSSDNVDLWNAFRSEICARCVLAGVTQLLNSKNDFTYSLEQKMPSVNKDVSKITTLLQFPIDRVGRDASTQANAFAQIQPGSDMWYAISDPLEENENIVLTAPNLVNDETYSSYCKFIHNIKADKKNLVRGHENSDTIVSSNGEYTLREGEYIIFFWKTEDSDDIPYTYAKYDHTTPVNIVSPTFPLVFQKNPDDLPPINDSLFMSLPSGNGTTDYWSIDGMPLTTYISQLQGSTYVLSGSSSIYTKKPNSIKITDVDKGTRSIFWILNKTVSGSNLNGNVTLSSTAQNTKSYAILFENGQTEYILQSGEYFMYSNAAKTQLVMLGSGTKIQRTVGGAAWGVEAIDYDEFIASGVNYLDTMWFDVPTTTDVIATEMLFYQLGPGNRIQLTTNKAMNRVPDKITFMNDGIYQGNGKIVKLTDSDGNFTGEVRYEANIITLEDYNVSFIDAEGQTTYLPERTSKDLAWNGYSLLNIDVSSSTPQALGHGQTIILYESDGDLAYIYTSNLNSDEEVDDTVTRFGEFLSSRELNLTGGRDIDATTVGMGGVVQPVSIYMYQKYGNTDDITYIDSQATIFVNVGETHTYDVPVSLLEGKYVIPITIDSNNITASIDIKTTEGMTIPFKDLSFQNDHGAKGTHYLSFSVTKDSVDSINISFTATNTPDGEGTSIVFGNPYKYEEAFDAQMFESILRDVQTLDKSHLFNYTYSVPKDILIVNPLDSKKFFDNDHVYNKYTIGMWQWNDVMKEEDSDILVVDKIK